MTKRESFIWYVRKRYNDADPYITVCVVGKLLASQTILKKFQLSTKMTFEMLQWFSPYLELHEGAFVNRSFDICSVKGVHVEGTWYIVFHVSFNIWNDDIDGGENLLCFPVYDTLFNFLRLETFVSVLFSNRARVFGMILVANLFAVSC